MKWINVLPGLTLAIIAGCSKQSSTEPKRSSAKIARPNKHLYRVTEPILEPPEFSGHMIRMRGSNVPLWAIGTYEGMIKHNMNTIVEALK